MKKQESCRYLLVPLAVILTLLLNGGCMTHYQGNKQITDENILSRIKLGKTTQSQVKTLIGEPSNTFTYNGEKEWMYTYYKMQSRVPPCIPVIGMFGGYDTKMNTLKIRFDENGVVKSVDKGTTRGGGGGVQDLFK